MSLRIRLTLWVAAISLLVVAVLALATYRVVVDTTADRERMSSELEIGFGIQRSFLPPVEDLAGVPVLGGRASLSAFFRPAGEMAGDLYDFFPLAPGRLGLVIGDVSGKGLPAALFMAVTHTLVRSAAHRSSGPADCLERVNRLLCSENRSQLFVTVLHAVLDLDRSTLTYASGGHMPPMAMSAEEGARSLPEVNGMVLGVMEAVEFEERTVEVRPGEVLLLFTDGLTEAARPDREFLGEERVLDILGRGAGDPPEAVLRKVLEGLEAFTEGQAPSDDLTMVALRVE